MSTNIIKTVYFNYIPESKVPSYNILKIISNTSINIKYTALRLKYRIIMTWGRWRILCSTSLCYHAKTLLAIVFSWRTFNTFIWIWIETFRSYCLKGLIVFGRESAYEVGVLQSNLYLATLKAIALKLATIQHKPLSFFYLLCTIIYLYLNMFPTP